MKSFTKTSWILPALGVVYAALFYHTEAGINLLLFDALLLLLTLRKRPELVSHRAFVWAVAGLLFAAGCVVVVNGSAAVFAHHFTYLLVLGFAQARELRFVLYGLLLGAITVCRGPVQWLRARAARREAGMPQQRGPGVKRVLLYGIPTVLLLTIFGSLYLTANEQLAAGLSNLMSRFDGWQLDGSVVRFGVLAGFGALLVVGLLYPRRSLSRLAAHEGGFRDYLERRRPVPRRDFPDGAGNRSATPPSHGRTIGLRDEYRTAILVFGALNLALAAVNVTDLVHVWGGMTERSAAVLSHYVHVGTWNLVAAVALAMVVVLYFFRANLNFWPQDRVLRPLARVWLAQNAFLTLSVGARNYHYVDAYGLAYGRVYVAFMLLLVLFGLYTLWRKLDQRLTLTYLLQANGLATWLLLLAFGAVNWSGAITRYNLATQEPDRIDWYYLTHGLDARNTFLLLDHPESGVLKLYRSGIEYHRPADWRSWNYADWRNVRALE